MERFYAPQKIELRLNDGTNEVIAAPYAGNGFEEQIAHFSECVQNGLKESPIVTHEQTLHITRQMDAIRKLIGITYPQDRK